MNILQVCAYAAPYEGNFISSLKALDEKMEQLGHKTIYAFCEYAKDQQWCKEFQKIRTVYFLPQRRARVIPKTYFELRRILKDEQINIVHSHFELYDLPLGAVTPKDCRMFWHLHDTIATGFENLPFYMRWLNILQYKYFSKRAILCSVSEKHLKFVCDLGFNTQNAIYVPNGTDFNRLTIAPKTAKKYDFLIFSWDFLRKGGDVVIKAARRLSKEGYSFKIGFVGNNNLWNNKEIVASTNEPWFIKQDFVPDVSELYNSTRCFLHVSRAEGCSYALLEAAYFGLPIISSDIEENLFLNKLPIISYTQVESEDDVYVAMKNQLDRDFKISQYDIELSRKNIMKHYSLNAWADKIISLYKQYVDI